jgi:hypothetical protein
MIEMGATRSSTSRRAFLAAAAAGGLAGSRAIARAFEAGPREPWGDSSRLGRPFSKDPSVIRFGGRYLLYYSMPPRPDDPKGGWGIGIAATDDLSTVPWAKVGEVPPAGEVEAGGICAPCARVMGGVVHLFYQTYGRGKDDAICHATSADGLRFGRDRSNPVFRPHGDWTCGRAIDAEVIEHGDRVLLLAATRDPAMKVQMLVAASAPRGSDLGRSSWTQLGDGPALRPEPPWERRCVEAPSIVARDGRLYLFYAGGYNNEPQQIGCAVGTDGVHWTRLSDDPLLPNGPPGSWNASESGHPGAFVDDDGRTYLFYQGNADRGRTWRIARVELRWTDRGPVLGDDRP